MFLRRDHISLSLVHEYWGVKSRGCHGTNMEWFVVCGFISPIFISISHLASMPLSIVLIFALGY